MADIQYSKDGIIVDGNLITWDTINLEKTKILYNNYILVKTETRYGRDYLTCNFLVDKDEWNSIKEDLSKYNITRVYLGEVCGKHSDVNFYVDSDIKEEISDINLIADFVKSNGTYSANYEGNPYWTLCDSITEAKLENQ